MESLNVLVTGGAGFIGSHVVDAYLAAGHRVAVLDDLSTGTRANVPQAVELVEMDLRSSELPDLISARRFDVVNHHAAQIDVRRSMSQPEVDASINVLGGINLLRAAAGNVKRFIYISTGGAVYGEPEYLPVDEAHPVRPFCGYGISKYAVELYAEMFRQAESLDYVILRYPNVYGPRQSPEGEAGVVAIFTQNMLRGEQCTIFGDGEQQRDFVLAEDCAAANLAVSNLAESPRSRVYNLATGVPTSVNELHATLARIVGHSLPARYAPAKSGETYRIYLDATRARGELGWVPHHDLDAGLRKTVQHFRER